MTTAAQRALANPAATRKLAMGIQRAATSTGSGGAVGSAGNRNAAASAVSMAPFAAAALPSLASAAASSSAHRDGAQVGNDEHHGANAPSAGVSVGRVAAAAQAFSAAAPPPTPASASSAATAPSKPATPGRLVPQKVSELKRSYGLGFLCRSDRQGVIFFCLPFASIHLCFVFLSSSLSMLTILGVDVGLRWVATLSLSLSVEIR